MQIITDSSTLYSIEQAKEKGFEAVPLCISIGDWHGKDLHMDYDRFYDTIKSGINPTSSQPTLGDVIDVFEKYSQEEIVNISMADGLSGTYQTACSAREMVENKDKITVFNSKTLCGPHRYMTEMAQKMKEEGKTVKEIIEWLKQKTTETKSWLIPQDFEFLKRGGRMNASAAAIGSVLKLKPILTLTKDAKQLDKFAVKRTFTSAVKTILDSLEGIEMGKDYIFYVVHARAKKDCETAVKMIREKFSQVEIQCYELSHAFITQGGPECVAIQYIKK